jgi:hypothetical protein
MPDDPLQPDIDRAARRARHYWAEDGLGEIVVGGVFLLVGLYFLAQALLPSTRAVRVVFSVGFPVLIVGLCVASRRLVQAAKDRYVHPRTGYVAFRRRRPQRLLTAFLGGAIAGLIVALLRQAPFLVSWIPAFEGLVAAATFLYVGRRTGLARFPVQGLLGAAMGLVLSVVYVNDTVAAAAFFGWLGLVIAVAGAMAFRSYLQHAPPPGDA